tara:strand:+ start:198 stop:422 length:225 start_codon:yes stop_codon:yes gene_type:complete
MKVKKEELLSIIEEVFKLSPFLENTWAGSDKTQRWTEVRTRMAKVLFPEDDGEFGLMEQIMTDSQVRRNEDLAS